MAHRAFPFHPSHAHNTGKTINYNKRSLLWHCLPALIPVPSQSLQKPTKRGIDAEKNETNLSERDKDKQALKLVAG